MRYIHDGKLRNTTIEPPAMFVVNEPVTDGRGRTDTAALMADMLRKYRGNVSPLIGHEDAKTSRWRWTDR